MTIEDLDELIVIKNVYCNENDDFTTYIATDSNILAKQILDYCYSNMKWIYSTEMDEVVNRIGFGNTIEEATQDLLNTLQNGSRRLQ